MNKKAFFSKNEVFYSIKINSTASNVSVSVRRLTVSRLQKNRSRATPLCGFLSAALGAGANASHCPIARPKRHLPVTFLILYPNPRPKPFRCRPALRKPHLFKPQGKKPLAYRALMVFIAPAGISLVQPLDRD